MVTERDVEERLDGVMVPGAKRSLVGLNMLREVDISDGNVSITLSQAALSPHARDEVEDSVRAALDGLPQVSGVKVEFVDSTPSELNQIKQVVAVMSGKGGVGKSLVTALFAVGLAQRGYQVGVLDADITGPSIPRMFGLVSRPAGSESGILPVLTRSGIGVMSVNLLLEHEDDAVIWRGPLIGNTIKQFWEDVLWGRLDYLLLDLPPGTADAPLTVMQSLPLAGVVVVFTPQELASMVVRKAVRMARDAMNVPILGVVENMSYLPLEGGGRLEIFGPSRGDEMARAARAPLLGQIPIDPELAQTCDRGEIELYRSPAIEGLVEAFLKTHSQ